MYEGSLRGSGIYGYETEVSFVCESELYDSHDNEIGLCDFDGDVEGYVNDFGNVSATCPKCGADKDLGNVRDDYY